MGVCLLRWQCAGLPGTPESRHWEGLGSAVNWIVAVSFGE